MLADPTGRLAWGHVCNVQLQFVFIPEVKNILLLPDAPKNVHVGELGVGSVAPIGLPRALEVLAELAVQDDGEEQGAAHGSGGLVLLGDGGPLHARGLRIGKDPGDIGSLLARADRRQHFPALSRLSDAHECRRRSPGKGKSYQGLAKGLVPRSGPLEYSRRGVDEEVIADDLGFRQQFSAKHAVSKGCHG